MLGERGAGRTSRVKTGNLLKDGGSAVMQGRMPSALGGEATGVPYML